MRDSPRGPEVLMVERNRTIVFGGGMFVFPGGKLDLGDAHKIKGRYIRHARNVTQLIRALGITAVREVFEETGILLTRASHSHRTVSNAQRTKYDATWRDRLAKDRCDMDRFFAVAGHYMDFRDIVYYARWITPPGQVKRYDTYFFLARAPRDQRASHDGWELVNAHWLTPQEALDLELEKKIKMMFPTRMNLRRLLTCHSVDDAFSKMRADALVPIMPKLEKREGRVMARLPRNAGYGKEELHQRLVV